MNRYLCIHGHFYQPPRENPWLEATELEDSAKPYHDWNERITAECYAVNGHTRILDSDQRIVQIVNNYSKISFNMGPTLLSWMEEKAPRVYGAVLQADRESQKNFGGHGSAVAQVYNHIIMPLATRRDKLTQIVWGMRDFEHRFKRRPEGMWLAETAVDLETLDLLAESGILYTILAPSQARRVRRLGAQNWKDVSGARIDPTRPYLLNLPSGRKISLFFYDGPIARAVAFEGLLRNGEHLAGRLLSGFTETRQRPQLMHIATDGESYGHHHRHGDMALAYALHWIEQGSHARITNYGEFLELFPPGHEVEIFENSSWSCVHGIERWRSDCGCNSGGYGHWNQSWRAPLRAALDWLRDELGQLFETKGKGLFRDPFAARNEYIDVILNRATDNVDRFLLQHAGRTLDAAERCTALELLEMQRHTLLMYTSCGWFFDELSGIETVQVIRYAGRALQLASELAGDQSGQIERGFVERLAQARSNLPEHGDGEKIYNKWIKPSIVDLRRVGAHYAVSSIFEEYGGSAKIHCYTVERLDHRMLRAGRARLSLGHIRIVSQMTEKSEELAFGVVHMGDHSIVGGIRAFPGTEVYEGLMREMSETFLRVDMPELMQLIDRHFSSGRYSLNLLFRDEQCKILNLILESTLKEAEESYHQIYEHHVGLMRFFSGLSLPVPRAFYTAAEFSLNMRLRRAFSAPELDYMQISALLTEVRAAGIVLEVENLEYILRRTLEQMADALVESPHQLNRLLRLANAMAFARRELPFAINTWQVQNIYYEMQRNVYPDVHAHAMLNDAQARSWLAPFLELGENLGMRVPEAPAPNPRQSITQEIIAQRRIPLSTYRLQFNHQFGFAAATAIVPYLQELGITDIYASPLFRTQPGSNHGYDVSDHSQINEELGGEAEFDKLVLAQKERGMGLLLDVVPNHMGINGPYNIWWRDVLENGPSSVYASYFDIDWQPATPELENKVLLAILEDQYGKVLERGLFRLEYKDGTFSILYHSHNLPVAPRSYNQILTHRLEALLESPGERDENVQELRSIITAISYLPRSTETEQDKVMERNREKEIIKRRIDALYQASSVVRAAIDESVRLFNGAVGEPRSFDLLDELLQKQIYRLAFWRVAADQINYRRFFDINELAAIRVEVPEVFQATHQLVLRLLMEKKVTGVRIDHADGLWNPLLYLRELQSSYFAAQVQARLASDRSHMTAEARAEFDQEVASGFTSYLAQQGVPWPLYVVVEKILAQGETLAADWPVSGTTGYDFLNEVGGIFVDGRSREAFDEIYVKFSGNSLRYCNLVNSMKKMIMLVSMSSEINALGHRLDRIAERNRRYRDFTLNGLTFALREVIACLPVYRTYVTGPSAVSERDRMYLEAAVAEAKKRNQRTAESTFDFILESLLLRNLADFSEKDQHELILFAMKFQQITGPIMAKGVEDTSFYVYNRLMALNEVGGSPERFGTSVEEFHARNLDRSRQLPHSMLATSTHDTKLSEDVRARLFVLSEIPEEWRSALERFSQLNKSKRTLIDSELAPDSNDEYLLYQALIGAWPTGGAQAAQPLAAFRERIVQYMMKAIKEAKVHTSWVNQNEPYEAAVRDFTLAILPAEPEAPESGEPSELHFTAELGRFAQRVAYYGRWNSLAQSLLKLTSPGVPDLYQGCELWSFTLVDPDNRGPVDFEQRRQLLSALRERAQQTSASLLAHELVESSEDGRIKLYTIWKALGLRSSQPELFTRGDYLPLTAGGKRAEHVCAFARTLGSRSVLVVVPRLIVGLTAGQERAPLKHEVWQDTWLAIPEGLRAGSYRDVFTGAVLTPQEVAAGGQRGLLLGDILSTFPVALLEEVDARPSA